MLSTQQMTVAVADDEPEIREFLRRILAHLGFEVVVSASNGHELVEHGLLLRPQLVVTDVRMPELSGVDAVRQLGRSVPLFAILVTGHLAEVSTSEELSDYLVALLEKPIRRRDLEPVLQQAQQTVCEFDLLHSQATSLVEAREHRRIVERAKLVVAERGWAPHNDAFTWLRDSAEGRQTTVARLATSLLSESD